MKNKTLILLAILLMVFLMASHLHAQKLPNVQKTSVYAPANVKVDGKPTEWNNKFEASNSATSVTYTMANDNEKLYLAMQLTDFAAINKLLSGGFKLTIKGANKDDKPVVINGMIVQAAGRGGITQKLKNGDGNMDSLIAAVNSQINNNIKDIGVKGVADIADTLISVYNEYDIKQAVKFDNNKVLTVELAIPLKYLSNLIIGDTFKYNFMLKGLNMTAMSVTVNGVKQDMNSLASMPGVTVVMHGSDGSDFQGLFNPTDFSGNYMLAKKL